MVDVTHDNYHGGTCLPERSWNQVLLVFFHGSDRNLSLAENYIIDNVDYILFSDKSIFPLDSVHCQPRFFYRFFFFGGQFVLARVFLYRLRIYVGRFARIQTR